MTPAMAVLIILALGTVMLTFRALYREWDAREKERRRAAVWERRALAIKQNRPGLADERARMVQFRARPLSAAEHARFVADWRRTRMRFVENPTRAIEDTDALVSMLMHARGVPAWTLEHDQATPLAWDHPELEHHYRAAHKIATYCRRGMASRVELEHALQSYKVICDRLLEHA